MVKTTILLDDDLYKRLVEECIERYGSTRKLSKLINEKIRLAYSIHERIGRERKVRKVRVKLGMKLDSDDIERLIEEGWRDIIKWST